MTTFQQTEMYRLMQGSNLFDEVTWISVWPSSSCDADDAYLTPPHPGSICESWTQSGDVKTYANVYVYGRQNQIVISILFLIGVDSCGEIGDGCCVTYSTNENCTLHKIHSIY